MCIDFLGKGKCMNARKKIRKYAKRTFAGALSIVLIFTLSALFFSANAINSNTVYAASMEVSIELREVEIDKLNDRVVLAAYLAQIPDIGVSGISFEVNYPDEFQLTEIENLELMGKGDKGISFGSSALSDKPYFIAFGSMDVRNGGANTETGEIALFTFKVKNSRRPLPVDTYGFSLSRIKATCIVEDDNYIYTQDINTNGETEYEYESISGDGTATGSGLITVNSSFADGKVPAVKTETVEKVISDSNENEYISFDLTESQGGSGEEAVSAALLLTTEGIKAISDSNKLMRISTAVGQLTFDNNMTSYIGSRPNGNSFVINIKKKNRVVIETKLNDAVMLDLTSNIVDSKGNKTVVNNFGGEAEVALDLPFALKNKALNCWAYTDTNYTQMVGSAEGNKFVFKTKTSGRYIIAEDVTLEAFKAEKNLSEGVIVNGTAVNWNDKDDAIYLLYDGKVTNETIKNEWKNGLYSTSANVKYVCEGAAKGAFSNVKVDGKSMKEQNFTFSGVSAGEYKLVVFKPGKYVPKIVPFTVDNAAVELGQQKLWLYGDVTYDGKVNAVDATQILRYVVKKRSFDEEQLLAADVNQDKKTNAVDATQIKRYVVKKSSALDKL